MKGFKEMMDRFFAVLLPDLDSEIRDKMAENEYVLSFGDDSSINCATFMGSLGRLCAAFYGGEPVHAESGADLWAAALREIATRSVVRKVWSHTGVQRELPSVEIVFTPNTDGDSASEFANKVTLSATGCKVGAEGNTSKCIVWERASFSQADASQTSQFEWAEVSEIVPVGSALREFWNELAGAQSSPVDCAILPRGFW